MRALIVGPVWMLRMDGQAWNAHSVGGLIHSFQLISMFILGAEDCNLCTLYQWCSFLCRSSLEMVSLLISCAVCLMCAHSVPHVVLVQCLQLPLPSLNEVDN